MRDLKKRQMQSLLRALMFYRHHELSLSLILGDELFKITRYARSVPDQTQR
jgi:hypothetical protein